MSEADRPMATSTRPWSLLHGVVTLQGLVLLALLIHLVLDREVVVRQVTIVDADGTVRARLGADLPDAIIDGRTLDRGAKIAGLLLYDGTGVERGGYVTFEPSGNVALTLDGRQHQSTLLVAGPEGASALRLFSPGDSQAIELRNDGDGPRLTIVQGGGTTHQLPTVDVGEEACAAYREHAENRDARAARMACEGRFAAEACRRCLVPSPE
ncbi:hypothetical protein GCM10028794_23600 [Silanimonas algicola]